MAAITSNPDKGSFEYRKQVESEGTQAALTFVAGLVIGAVGAALIAVHFNASSGQLLASIFGGMGVGVIVMPILVQGVISGVKRVCRSDSAKQNNE